MSAKEIGTYIGNGFDKVKEIILAVFGKTVDAYNDYDVVVNVTEHGKGPNDAECETAMNELRAALAELEAE